MRIQKARAAAQKIAADRWETERKAAGGEGHKSCGFVCRSLGLERAGVMGSKWGHHVNLGRLTVKGRRRFDSRSGTQARTQSGRSRGAQVFRNRVQSQCAGGSAGAAGAHQFIEPHRAAVRPVIRIDSIR